MITQFNKKKIFLGYSFTKYLEKGRVHQEIQEKINKIMDILKLKNYKVNCALVREKFGEQLMTPKECTPLDFDEIKNCDVFLAFPSNSGGVHIELGWASSLNKKIILFLNEKENYSPLIYGLNQITAVETYWYKDEAELFEKLNKIKEGI